MLDRPPALLERPCDSRGRPRLCEIEDEVARAGEYEIARPDCLSDRVRRQSAGCSEPHRRCSCRALTRPSYAPAYCPKRAIRVRCRRLAARRGRLLMVPRRPRRVDTSKSVSRSGYTEVSARGWSGARRPVDCRIVRRCNPIINLLFTPCTLKKEISYFCRRSGGFIGASPSSITSTC